MTRGEGSRKSDAESRFERAPHCTIDAMSLLLATLCWQLSKTSYPVKEAGGVKIEIDVHRTADDAVRPVLVWIHGGALLMGSRSQVPKNLLDLCATEGFALVSIDYRLAPQAKLPDIIEDVKDSLAWVRTKGPGLAHLDPKKVVVAGGSAGGYLTLMTGIAVEPRPVALVAYWGYGDVDGDWYTRPSEHYRKAAPLVKREDALKAVGHGVLTGTTAENQRGRGQYYRYLRQNGLWTKEVTGFDPERERNKIDPYCPVRNVTADYPPTMLIHGTADTDVPYEQSAAMARELARQKVKHELVTVTGAGHGLAGGDKRAVADANRRALEFLREHLK